MLHEKGSVFPPRGCPLHLLPKTHACTRTHAHTRGLPCFTSGMWRDLAISARRPRQQHCEMSLCGRSQRQRVAAGPYPRWWGTGVSVKGQTTRPTETVYSACTHFRSESNVLMWLFAAFLQAGKIKASKGFAFQRRQMSSANTQNGQQTHTVCANEITTKHCTEFGSAVLERLLQAIVAKQQLPMIELKVNVSVGNLERAQRTTKVYLELNTLILLEDVAVEGKDACRTKKERSSISRLSSTTSEA